VLEPKLIDPEKPRPLKRAEYDPERAHLVIEVALSSTKKDYGAMTEHRAGETIVIDAFADVSVRVDDVFA
jgi:hypothetical protein